MTTRMTCSRTSTVTLNDPLFPDEGQCQILDRFYLDLGEAIGARNSRSAGPIRSEGPISLLLQPRRSGPRTGRSMDWRHPSVCRYEIDLRKPIGTPGFSSRPLQWL